MPLNTRTTGMPLIFHFSSQAFSVSSIRSGGNLADGRSWFRPSRRFHWHQVMVRLWTEAGLRQEVRGARHRLHAAGHDDVVTAGGDHELRDLDRADRRRADLVDRVGGNLLRDPCRDRGLACGGLTCSCLQHLAHHDVADVLAAESGPLEPAPDRGRAEFGGGHGREAAAHSREGRADCGDDDCARHRAKRSHGAGHPTRCGQGRCARGCLALGSASMRTSRTRLWWW